MFNTIQNLYTLNQKEFFPGLIVVFAKHNIKIVCSI